MNSPSQHPPVGNTQLVAGIRPLRTLLGILLGLFLAGVVVQISTIHLEMEAPGEFALAIPAVGVLLLLLGLAGLWKKATRGDTLLRKGELLCILYAMLIASPLMTQGFWHRIVSITATIPRGGDFQKMDALGDRMWPHGPNLLQGAFEETDERISFTGMARRVDLERGNTSPETGIAMENAGPGSESSVRIRLPLEGASPPVPGSPYLVSVLVRPTDLAADAFYFGRLRADDTSAYTEVFFARSPGRVTLLHPDGFLRTGLYGVPAPPNARREVVVEFGLVGQGKVEFLDPKMMDVSALENVFTGVMEVTEEDFAAMDPAERSGVIVRPDNPWSLAGLWYYATGFVPWGEWAGPIAVWGSLVLLVLTGALCLNVLFRKKWMETERYSLPLTRIPLAITNTGPDSIWRNRIFWTGFGVSLCWALLKGWNFYNPAVPDTNIEVPLEQYFGEGWGGMWTGVQFRVLAVLVAVAVFIELNILLSIVAGYFLFQALYWVGSLTAADVFPGYPFAQEQQIASFLVYAGLTIAFSWKYLRAVVATALRGGKGADQGELMSYRAAFLVMGGVLAGGAGWAVWVGVSIHGMLCFLLFLILVGFVSSKFRAEAGLPWGYFTPNNAALILLLLGGLSTFGPEMLLLAFLSSFFMSVAAFFLIPGAQLEMMEIGRREGIRPSHVTAILYLGVIGGILIGGWIFLSNAYSMGGDSFRYSWAFDAKAWYFNDFDLLLSRATAEMTGTAAETAAGVTPSFWAYLYGGIGTGVLVVLRQLFAGFWFHPVGFVLGPSHMMGFVWGSFLVAWALRLIFVKFGGAEAVRTLLQPFFVGVFVAAILSMFWWGIYGSYAVATGTTVIYQGAP